MKDRNAFKAGLFILISLALAIGVLVAIRGPGMGPAQMRTVAFRLADDLGGLDVGDDVRLGGVKVGSVRELQLSGLDTPDARVLVRFSLPPRYVLREDAVVRIQSALTGPTNLNIESMGTAKPAGETFALVGQPDAKSVLLASLGRTSPHLEAILSGVETQTLPRVNETVAAFRQTADSATALVRHANEKVDPVVARYDGVAQYAGEMMVEVRDLVGDSKTDFRGTVKNLNQATAAVRDKLPNILDEVNGILTKVDGAVTSARSALQDVQRTVANTRDMSATLRSVITGNRGRLDSIVTSLKATSDNLKATSIEVRRSPWRLLYKPEPNELANLNLYDTARQFAEGAGSLSDAATALRDAMADPNTDKAQLQKLVAHLDESFQNFHQAESKLWTAVKE
jgi:ABC-type transporter Mla subunit MlaD